MRGAAIDPSIGSLRIAHMKKRLGRQMALLIALQAFAIIMTGVAGIIQPAQAVLSGDMSPKAVQWVLG